MSVFNKLFHTNRASPKNALSSTMSFLSGNTTAGQNVTERTVMQNTAIYARVRVLAENLTTLPLYLYQLADDGSKQRVNNHPLSFLLHDAPSPGTTSFIFKETMMTHLPLWGNAYAQIIRNGQGQVAGPYPLMFNRIDVNRARSGELYYAYTRNYDDYQAKNESKQVVLLSGEVLHIASLDLGGLIGYSPVTMAKNTIGLSLAAEQYGSTFFKSDTAPGGILEHPNVTKDPEHLRRGWQSQLSGPSGYGIAALKGGMTFHQLSIPPGQAQFLGTRKFQLGEIIRIFRIPPRMTGDLERSTFSNIEQQSLKFVKYTLNPWCVRWGQTMNQQLLNKEEQGRYLIKFNIDGLMRGDHESRMNGYAIGRQNGQLSANDIRELEDLNRTPTEDGGDEYLVNGNMLPVRDAGQFCRTKTTGNDQA